jgi:hypothetical protein
MPYPGQPTLPGFGPGELWAASSDPVAPTGTTSGPERPPEAVCNRWHCLGTPECLCGQGEMSDDPLWIESY